MLDSPMPLSIDTSSPVLVTGASGYIASWLVKQLLEAGLTVHATVRDLSSPDKVEHLQRLDDTLPGELRLFEADLLVPGSFGQAMDGCSIVFHTASPFLLRFNDPEKDLIQPALLGTENVLNTATKTATVKRVVLTSSCAAIYGDVVDCISHPNDTLTEDVWNTTSTVRHQPYAYSKTIAEKKAWEIAKSQSNWKLVVINPSLVVGPSLGPKSTSGSHTILAQFGNGLVKTGVPELEIGIVDVRDVADAHFRAAFIENAEGRHILCNRTASLMELADMLRDEFSAYPLPKRVLPKWLIWLVGPLVDKNLTREMIKRNMGKCWRADNRKSTSNLGVVYRPIEHSVREMFRQMVNTGELTSL
jgi:nucleoside-diphosphate-sugar epimerase